MKKFTFALLAFALLLSVPALAASAADYSDVARTDWYYDAVDYAVSNALFSGTSKTAFSPALPMTRGMFVTVLCGYAGAAGHAAGTAAVTETINLRAGPTTDSAVVTVLHAGDTASVYGVESGWYRVTAGGASGYIRRDLITVKCGPFGDVSPADYYAGAVVWAYESGLVSGTSAAAFSPHSPLSREALCAILYRFVEKRGLTLPAGTPKTGFTDTAEIRAGFLPAVTAMQLAGVVSGRTDGSFGPKASATRAEVAAMLRKFIQSTGASAASVYGYYGTVAKSAAVSDSFFDDSCFIGHSLVLGMQDYFGLPSADYYAANGMYASTISDYADFPLPDGGQGTLAQALGQKSYGKVYVMLGVNELSGAETDRQNFYADMARLLSLIRQTQPGARLYLISLTPVTKAESDSSAIFNRDNIVAYNGVLQQLSRDKGAGYLDFFTLFADADGYMPPDGAASDGIHPVQAQYAVMKDYLKTHT